MSYNQQYGNQQQKKKSFAETIGTLYAKKDKQGNPKLDKNGNQIVSGPLSGLLGKMFPNCQLMLFKWENRTDRHIQNPPRS